MCSNAILNHPGLKPLIEAGVFDPAGSIHNCVQDIIVIKFIRIIIKSLVFYLINSLLIMLMK